MSSNSVFQCYWEIVKSRLQIMFPKLILSKGVEKLDEIGELLKKLCHGHWSYFLFRCTMFFIVDLFYFLMQTCLNYNFHCSFFRLILPQFMSIATKLTLESTFFATRPVERDVASLHSAEMKSFQVFVS